MRNKFLDYYFVGLIITISLLTIVFAFFILKPPVEYEETREDVVIAVSFLGVFIIAIVGLLISSFRKKYEELWFTIFITLLTLIFMAVIIRKMLMYF